MTDPKFRRLFEREFSELLQSEGKLSIAEGDAAAAAERLEALAKIESGLKEVELGKTSSSEEVFKRMRTRHKIPKRA
jgi:hypothetical protein